MAATSRLYGGIEAGGTKFVCAVGETPQAIQASTSIPTTTPRATLNQVIAFLNDEHNRALLRGVIAAGNTNFGAEFGYAGEVIARKCGVPYLYRFELMGTDEDVRAVRAGLADFWKDQTCHQPSQLQSL